MPKAMLIDVSKCMGCRGCQVICKEWNDRPAEKTENKGSYENPPELSASTWNRVEFYEGYNEWTFRTHRCLHCTDASCVNVCPTGSMHHEVVEITGGGGEIEIVLNDQLWCIGCGYCAMACPFDPVRRSRGPPRA